MTGKRTRVGLRIANREDVVDLTGADERIDFRHLRFQFIAITFDQTTGDNQSRRFAVSLQPRRFENRVDRFLLGRVDKATGVDDDRVSLAGVRGHLITICFELAHHHLAIDEVLGTTETDKSNFFHIRKPDRRRMTSDR